MASTDKEAAARYVAHRLGARDNGTLTRSFVLIECSLEHHRDATPSNPRGIPYAPFVDKVEDYVTSRADVEPTLRRFQEMIA